MSDFYLNHYGLDKPGEQPVRVLYPQIIHEFETIKSMLSAQFPNAELDKLRLLFLTENISAIGPNVSKTRIQLHDSFISFLWSYCYGILLTLPMGGKEFNKLETDKARDLLKYSNELMFKSFREWPSNLPNPENQEGHNKDYIARASSVFLGAILFVLFHEFGHVAIGHINSNLNSISDIRKMEYEADNFAAHYVKYCKLGEMTRNLSIICAVSSLAFGRDTFNGADEHPEPEDRLTAVLEYLNYPDTDITWAQACWTFLEWQIYFGLFSKNLDLKSNKATYYGLVKEFKEYKAR